MKKRKLCNHNILWEVEPGLSTGPLRYGQNVRIRKSTYTKTGLMELFPGDFELIFLNFEIITQCQFHNKTFTYKHGENLSVGFNTYHGYSTKNLRFSRIYITFSSIYDETAEIGDFLSPKSLFRA